ncbi:MAG: phosphoglycerate dehydrogenase [Chromatiales bacterium]|nr:phosphoglycerate dehydrogenase [Chromatiales bacterium]
MADHRVTTPDATLVHHFSRPNADLRCLLLEGVHPSAEAVLRAAGFEQIERLPGAVSGRALAERLGGVHVLGIRSRSRVDAEALGAAADLRAIGCFCIGTDQVDLDEARARGVPVFNAPFSNTRSVAELVLAELVLLLRDVPRKNAAAHRGEWRKSAGGAYEVRGKRLGIVGYGHIGTQIGVLAEALGMRVRYYDVQTRLALGNAEPVRTLDELLAESDAVTLHVPEAPDTVGLIGAAQLARMRRGAVLVNASRGSVVDIAALADALESGHLAGAAIDVFPAEPRSNDEPFESALRRFDNVILTPHVGGSTEEAQERIGVEVAEKLVRFNDNGSTLSAVNFPEVSLPPHRGTYRLLHIHRNRPGVLAQVNAVFSDHGINIEGEFLQTDEAIGYVVVDFDMEREFAIDKLERLKRIDGTLRARILTR